MSAEYTGPRRGRWTVRHPDLSEVRRSRLRLSCEGASRASIVAVQRWTDGQGRFHTVYRMSHDLGASVRYGERLGWEVAVVAFDGPGIGDYRPIHPVAVPGAHDVVLVAEPDGEEVEELLGWIAELPAEPQLHVPAGGDGPSR